MKRPVWRELPWPVIGLLALVAIYLATTLPSLPDDPIVGGDEGWIMSASARLAEEGVFGSDLFAGFYGAEEHYYFNLPLHHLMLAGVFRLADVSMTSARAVSVVFGLAVLLLTFVLGKRIGGDAAGLLAATLVVLLRLNLTPFTGLTLTDLGATVRYDLIAVPYCLGAVLLLARWPHEVTPLRALSAGLLIGLAALTQFIGAFVAVPAALFLLASALPASRRLLLVALLGLGVVAPFVPYGVYVAQDIADFKGQARAVEQELELLDPGFYLRQLEREPDRYDLGLQLSDLPDTPGEALKRPAARLALLVVGPLAAGYELWRGRRDPRRRLLGLVLVSLVVELALFESTKRFVYWVIVVPFLCAAIADLAVALWGLRPRLAEEPGTLTMLRWPARVAVALVLGLFLLEGLAVAAMDLRDARSAPSYDALAQKLRAALPADARAAGDNRLWPALHDRDYRSLHLLFYHTNPRISRGRRTDVFGAMERIGADYLLISPLTREVLSRLTPEDSAAFESYMSDRMERVGVVEDLAYGPIEVFRAR